MNSPVQFPAGSLPAEPAYARLLGLYPQRRTGLWMQRIRVLGGRLTRHQWNALADIAEQLTPGEPLHLTTRQDLEIHGLSEQAVPRAQLLLDEAGLTGLGACGDTIRNVTVCPCSGVAPQAPELIPLARRLTDLLQTHDGAFSLPRKLKISLSACPQKCGQPWINDLGLAAVPDDDGWKIQAVIAGSLGGRPATGIPYPRLLEPWEILPMAMGVLRVFAAQGDREHRHKARLRHVRERLGDDAFLSLLDRDFQAVLQSRSWPDVRLAEPQSSFAYRRQLRFAGGNLPSDLARTLGSLAERDDLRMRIANHHQIVLFGRDEQAIDDAITRNGLEEFGTSGPRIVVCPGTRWCARGLADTGQLATAVRERLNGSAAEDVLIAISGCPNGCAHSSVADVGAIGGITGSQPSRIEAWNIVAGGERGQGPGLARPVAGRLTLDDAAARIAELAIEAAAGRSGVRGANDEQRTV